MNIIFKPFNGKENHPHLVEIPERPCKENCESKSYCFDTCSKEGEYQKDILLAKANAVPFREEDADDVELICFKSTGCEFYAFWKPDKDKIYSVDGEYKIETPNWIHPEDKFAVLLKDGTVKEEILFTCDICGHSYSPSNLASVLIHSHEEGSEVLSATCLGIKGKKIKEPYKVESQDKLWRELLDKDDTDYNQELIKEALSKFRISRINAE